MITTPHTEAAVDFYTGGSMPRLSAPTQVVFFISLTLAIAALIVFFVVATPLGIQTAFWIAIIAYVVIALGCVLSGV